MSVIFYHNNSDNRCLTKSLQQIGTALSVKFKDDSSIINPELIVTPNVDLFGANYCQITEFKNRYYFIEDIVVSQQRIIVKCKEDLLMSYKNEILNMKGYLRRTAYLKKSNTYITDKGFTIQNNKFPNVTKFSTRGFGDYGDNGWVLAVASNLMPL